jgi:hypothetical protein
MQIVNGASTQSYRKCIDFSCNRLPTNVLKGEHPRFRYAIQILFCDAHTDQARETAIRDFKGINFNGFRHLSWLKRAQEAELKTQIEQSSPRTKEG